MSRVLLVAYYFPPVGGAGAQRPLKFARHLVEQGHEPVVLTGPGRTGSRWTPSDPTLEQEIPSGVRVVRVPAPEPEPPEALRSRLERFARRESNWAHWWQDGIVSAGRTIGDVDVVYTIMSPFSSAEGSLRLSRELGVGWIADLGDPWALDEMMIYPTGVHRRLETRRMRRLLGTATGIVMSTPEAARQLVAAFPELAGRPVVSIPNGYDAADFEADVVLPRGDGKFRIVHTGYLHTELGLQQKRMAPLRRLLGGATPGVDILTRSHVYLLEAIDRLLARDPGLRDRLEVHLAGVLSEVDREVAARSPVTVLHGYLSHADSIALMRSADLLFLPMQDLPPGRRSSTVPGKTYEYLAAGRPILGAVPEGDTRDILKRAGHSVCGPGDTEAIADAISVAARTLGDDAVLPHDYWEVVHRFERRELARRLVEVVEQVVPVEALRRERRADRIAVVD